MKLLPSSLVLSSAAFCAALSAAAAPATPEGTMNEFIDAAEHHDNQRIIALVDLSGVQNAVKQALDAALVFGNDGSADKDPAQPKNFIGGLAGGVAGGLSNIEHQIEALLGRHADAGEADSKSSGTSWQNIGTVDNCAYSDKRQLAPGSVSFLLSCDVNGKKRTEMVSLRETDDGWKIIPDFTAEQLQELQGAAGAVHEN